MRAFRKKAITAGLLLAVSIVVLPRTAADALAPQEQGWWSQANPGTSSLGVGTPVQAPTPPDVPANGLLVEGGSSQSAPVAYAALIYLLADGGQVGSLTLGVAANSATTPNSKLELCPLTQTSMQAEQNGPMSDAPAYSCKTNVTASPSSDGKTYTFAVSSLVSDDALAVAILPTQSTDRVVFDQPSATSLAVADGASANGTGASLQGSGGASTSAAPTSSSGGSAPTVSSGAPVIGSSAPAASLGGSSVGGTAASTPSIASTATSATASTQAPTTSSAELLPTVATSSSAKAVAVIAAILLALVGAAVWIGAGNAAVRGASAIKTGGRSAVDTQAG